jgi:RimJ/RimL family protein N-acetyltransferase
MAILETPRLILRPFDEKDVDLLSELMANPDFMRFSLGIYSRDQTLEFLDKLIGWQNRGLPSLFAMIFRETDALIGYCGFYHQHIDQSDDIEIGYRLQPECWNKGITTEAARAVRDHAFRDLKLPRVISLVHYDNIPSRRVAEKIGMTFEKEILFRGFPTQVFALIREQWLARSGA